MTILEFAAKTKCFWEFPFKNQPEATNREASCLRWWWAQQLFCSQLLSDYYSSWNFQQVAFITKRHDDHKKQSRTVSQNGNRTAGKVTQWTDGCLRRAADRMFTFRQTCRFFFTHDRVSKNNCNKKTKTVYGEKMSSYGFQMEHFMLLHVDFCISEPLRRWNHI